MFSSISWYQFFVATCVLLAAYYIVIGWLYYKTELSRFLLDRFRMDGRNSSEIMQGSVVPDYPQEKQAHDRFMPVFKNDAQLSVAPNPAISMADNNEEWFSKLEELTRALSLLFTSAGEQSYLKPELTTAIQIALRPFASLQDNPLRSSVDRFIQDQALAICGIEYEQQEINLLWK